MDNDTQQIPRPLPVPTKVSQPYWDGCREGRLRIQRCSACGTHLFYPVYMCHECTSQKLEWIDASGRGTVYSYSVIYRAPYAGLSDSGPYTVALVELEEGPIMMSQIVDVALAAGDGALTATDAGRRHALLLRLQRSADRTLADATNAACAVIAGWRPA